MGFGNYDDQFPEARILFPGTWRSEQLLREFARIVTLFHAAKRFSENDHMFDAYSCMVETMKHWAKIVLIEKGIKPELLVWEQVRRYNVGVYKLYEELLTSPETIEQRVRLIMLAAEFSMMSKMRHCCQLLVQILDSRDEPWSLEEIESHPELAGIEADWPLLISRLVKRNILREITHFQTGDIQREKIRYIRGA